MGQESRGAWFHTKDGWYFQRTEEGGVRIRKSLGVGFGEERVVLDPDTWASVVAAVCWEGENAETFQQAKTLHTGLGPMDFIGRIPPGAEEV